MVAMAGEENRRIFFNDRNLWISHLSRRPNLDDDINVKTEIHNDAPLFIKRLTHLLHRDRVKQCTPTLCFIYLLPRLILLLPASLLPLIFEDINGKMKGWETEGKMNPFNQIYDPS